MLKQLKGVKSISIDPNQGKVIVVGNVNPMILIKLLQKMGKKVQLCSFDKRAKEKVSSHHKQNHHSQCCHESSDNEDVSETVRYDDHKHKTHHHHHERSKTKHDHHNMFGFDNQHQHQHVPQPQPSVTGYHQPMSGSNYQQQFSGYDNHHPTMPWHQPQHMAYARPPSMYPISRPLYGYHGHGQPTWPTYGSRLPRYNPMIHYNSYADNYRYTMYI
uniref:Histidine-rich glycoprotein-like n=2 Tax=Cicer arietinum TaxID=3827 RepID=A0A1S3E389_CICAR|nr:histidine-rich glycoprotein-like [Cicer arietinum]